MTFSVIDTFKRAWVLLRKNLGRVVLLSTLLVIACNILAQVVSIPFSFVFSFLGFYFFFGLFKVSFVISKGQEPQFDDLFIKVKPFISYLLASFALSILAVLFAFLALFFVKASQEFFPMVPAFVYVALIVFLYLVFVWFIARTYLLIPFYILDQDKGPVESIRCSFKATRGKNLSLIGFCLLASLLYIGGILLLLVGLLILLPWVLIGQALIYKELS